MKIALACVFSFVACLLTGCHRGDNNSRVKSITVQEDHVYYYVDGLEKAFTVLFLSDTHFTIEDERGREFYDFSKRMGGAAVEPRNYGESNGRDQALLRSLDKAKKEQAALVMLGGDILNFPSLASVERLKAMLDASGLNWSYIAGNHDWHYEGEPGNSAAQREKWQQTNLMPLYQDRNPLYSAQVIHGINFVMIDNSIFEITEEQLAFFKEQVGKGFPIVLSMHIPIYVQGHNIDYGCGNPDWNKVNDCYYEIERREPWPEKGFTETTYQFRDCVINNPNVIGVYAGHSHEKAVDFIQGKIQYVCAANYNDHDVIIHFLPSGVS